MRSHEIAALVALAALIAIGSAALAEDQPPPAPGTSEQDKGFFDELKDDIVEGAESVQQETAAALPDVPSGAVVAFNREKCPAGWSEFPPAEGRVIRGTGDSGDGRPVRPMEIGEAVPADRGREVMIGVPWLGLLICEKD